MEESQHFSLEQKLNGLYECLDKVQIEFVNLRRGNRTNKRMRPMYDQRMTFERNIAQLRVKWCQNFGGIFELLTDLSIYDKTIADILRGLRTAKVRYRIDDQDYGYVLKSIVKCIIALIMDDQRVSKTSAEVQVRRIYVLEKFLTIDLAAENSIDEDSDIEIDVTSIPTQGTQIPTSTTCDENGNNSQQTNTYGNQSVEKALRELESLFALEVLFDALSKHTSRISEEETDLRVEIYHIVNITYILDCVQTYLKNLRIRIQAAKNSSQVSLDAKTLARLKSAMQKYEERISKDRDLLDIENPLMIFKEDLRKISFQLRLLIPWLK